jgi:hypothetical protein
MFASVSQNRAANDFIYGYEGVNHGDTYENNGTPLYVYVPATLGTWGATGGAWGSKLNIHNLTDTAGYVRVSFYDQQGINVGPIAGSIPASGVAVADYQRKDDLLFLDSFESGNFDGWNAAVTGDGDLSVSTAAAYSGRYGMQAVINDTTSMYVSNTTPASEAEYHARFYVNPNQLTMASGNVLTLLTGSTASADVFFVQMQKTGSTYQVRVSDQSGSLINSSWYDLTAGWNAIEIFYLPGNLTGQMSLWVGGVLKQTLNNLDNDGTKVEAVRLGAMNVASGTNGTNISTVNDTQAAHAQEPGYRGDCSASTDHGLVCADSPRTLQPLLPRAHCL